MGVLEGDGYFFGEKSKCVKWGLGRKPSCREFYTPLLFYLKKNNYPKDKVYIDGLDTKVTNIAENLSNFRLFKSWVLSTF